jgi:peroxiredoxin
MRPSRIATFASLLAVGGLTTAIALAAATAEIGKPAPEFALKDQSGKEVKLSDLRGKIVVLEWFNGGCPVTVRHHSPATPTMRATAQKYQDKGVVWLAICSQRGSTAQGNAEYAQKFGVPYAILDDSSGKVGKAYGATNTPHMFIIDAKGTLAYAGAIDDNPNGNKPDPKNYVAQALDELLAGTTVTQPKTKAYGCGISYAN